MFDWNNKFKIGFFILFSGIFLIGLIIYCGTLNAFFVSDDFIVLDNLQKNKIIYGTSFRPFSNLSLLADFNIAGVSPFFYKVINLLIHLGCTFLVFILTSMLYRMVGKKESFFFSCTSAILFFIYPFHHEAVVWITCRGVLWSTLLFITALIFYLKNNSAARIISVVCFLTGLFFYESVIVLPFIALLLSGYRRESLKNICRYLAYIFLAVSIYVLTRYYFTHQIAGTYFSEIFLQFSFFKIIKNFFIVCSRCIVPPQVSTTTFVLLTIITILIILFTVKKILKNKSKKAVLLLFAMTGISLVPAIFIGINSHDTEGGRLLYLPGIFICMTVSYFINELYRKKRVLGILFFSSVSLYFLFYLFQYNKQWIIAGKITSSTIRKINDEEISGKLYIIGLPGQYKGAFVFRNGFKHALKMFCPTVPFENVIPLSTKEINNKNDYEIPIKYNSKFYQFGRFKFNIADSSMSSEDQIRTYKLSFPNDKILYFSEDSINIFLLKN